MIAIRALTFSLCCFHLVGQMAPAAEASLAISLQPDEVFQGAIAEIKASGADLVRVKSLWRDRMIPLFPSEGGSYMALVGIDLEERPGAVEIVVRGWDKRGEVREKTIALKVREKTFPGEHISVPPGFDRIDEPTRKRIEKEQAQLARLWMTSSPRRLWEGGFIAPVGGGVTSPFGLRRVINGLPRAPHSGVDLKASTGAEVFAANHGQVVLREEFFFSGKSIVLDHGGGLYTMYFHLDDFHVNRGALVRKGDLLGRAGMTGRVTGPHLHWGVRLNGARVDPFELFRISIQ